MIIFIYFCTLPILLLLLPVFVFQIFIQKELQHGMTRYSDMLIFQFSNWILDLLLLQLQIERTSYD